jgi:peroxiredoxin
VADDGRRRRSHRGAKHAFSSNVVRRTRGGQRTSERQLDSMEKEMRLTSLILACIALTVAQTAAFAQDGAKASDFTLKDTAGKEVKLSDYAGKVVVLEWTNKDCPIVQRHYAQNGMQDLARKWQAKGIVWLGVDSTSYAKSADISVWRADKKIDHAVLLDPTGAVGRAYGAKTTPHMYIVKDGARLYEGAIDDGAKGEATVNYVEKALEELAAGKEISEAKTKPYGCSVKYGKDGGTAKHAETGWLTSFSEAQKLAKKSKKPILMDFTGSDWCGWCVKLKKEVFDHDEFKTWAAKNVVLLELDFPKQKELSDELKKQNAELKEKYPIRGYPTIVIVGADGDEIGRLGYEKGGPEAWIKAAEKAMKK